jgi:ATP-dependent exoDNAse (exonuclease V) alpha subunit
MNPRINVGKGVTGCVRYCLGEGRDPKTGELKPHPLDGSSRVAWVSGTGFGWTVETLADADQARREMEFAAQNQKGQAQQDCMHLSLSWAPGEQPTREQMEEAARDALKALGMENARALFVSHQDEAYFHVHIVASNINPATGYRYDLAGSWRTLSKWAEGYERDHGGVISTRRETANELRAAIKERDAAGVLEALTKQRSTFTPAQLENALAKEIKGEIARAQFADKILDHADTVHLSDRPGGPTTRYTTRAVIEAELHVLRAADALAQRTGFQIDDRTRAQILNAEKFDGISREQARAFRHATGSQGLAIIDGQAGTGKSYTLAAIREAYEASGAKVIGLALANKVARKMEADGFGHAATLHSELFALNNGRRQWDARTVVVVDEAAMIDTKLMAMLTAHAHDAGAKLLLVGDDRQLSSIDRGGMFGALKDRHGAAELSEVKRQYKIDERRAAEMMAEGNFHDALGIYQGKGAIHWTRTQGEARAELVEQWAKDSAAKPDKTRFVFAYTNDDVNQLNAALRGVRKQRGELGEDTAIDTAHGRHQFAAGDRIQFTGTDKKQGIYNATTGTIEAIDGSHIAVRLDDRAGKTISFDAANFDKFRHGYAGTIYKGQGDTLDQTYLYHSEHWRSAASYVALTRHRDQAQLFVARNTAGDIKQLARQMGRVDDRRAASMFHHRQEIGPVRPLTAREILERFAGDTFRQRPDQNRRPHTIEQPAAEMRGARRARPLDQQQRPPRQREGTGKMDDTEDEEQQRKRRAGVGIDIEREARPQQQRAANDHPHWKQADDGAWDMTVAGERVASLIQYPDCWLSVGVGTDNLPNYGWDNVDFASLAAGKETLEKWWHHARNGEAYQPERPDRPEVTRAAIERDPWNAVRLALPIDIPDATPEYRQLLLDVATAARDLRFALDERAGQAVTPEQQKLWSSHAENAGHREQLAASLLEMQTRDEPLSAKSIDYDPWTAVYWPIPPDADAALLQKAHDAAMQCAGAVAGEPGPPPHAFEPELFGKGQPREQNFERAVRRIDELAGRLRAISEEPQTEIQQQPGQPLTLDDIAERVQRIIDDPTRQADELDPAVLEALQVRRAGDIEAAETAARAAEDELLRPTAGDDDRHAHASGDEPASESIDDGTRSEEQTDDEQEVEYDRWTGQPISDAGHEITGSHSFGGGGRGAISR